MKNMYKIFGAAAIIGLFLLSSVASTGLAGLPAEEPLVKEEQQVEEEVQEQQQPQQQIPGEATEWDGSGQLPYNDGDGQDGGMYLYNVYDIPELDDYDTSPCPMPPEGIVDPQYITARIMIFRGPDWPFETNSKFKTRIRNIGAPHLSLGPEVELRVFHPLSLGYRVKEKTILPIEVPIFGFRDVETEDAMLWYITGGTAWVRLDPEDDVDEYYDGILGFRPRFRRFVGNIWCPYPSSLGYFNV